MNKFTNKTKIARESMLQKCILENYDLQGNNII